MNKITIFTIILIFALSSCLTEKKLKNHAVRYYAERPGELAHKCADEYPVTVTPGDTIRTVDTTVLPGVVLPCPDRIDINGVVKHDTVRCPGSIIIHDKVAVHDTVLDVARLAAMRADSAAQGVEKRAILTKLVQTTIEKDKAQKEAKTRLWQLLGLGAFSLFLLFLVVKFIIL